MNSDGRQLLINQETVCQPADWKSSPSSMFTHTFAHKHIPIWKYTHICAILWRFGEQHEHHTDIHTVHIPFIWIPCACCRVEANHAFPSDSMSTVCYYLYAPTTPTGARPLLNMEKPSEGGPECKRHKRLQLRQNKWHSGLFMLLLWGIVCYLQSLSLSF